MPAFDEDDFEPLPPRRPLFRRKRILIPLALLLMLVAAFFALRTPDTDRAEMIAKYGGGDAQFVAGPAGQQIHYRDQGKRDGPVMILLHGSTSSLLTWQPLVAILGKDYRVITLDFPGHGLTGGTPDKDYSIGGMMAAIDVVVARLDIDRFILGGNSMGGWVAWRYTLEHPDRVEALLLLNAGGMPLRKGEKPPPSNLGFRMLQSPVGRWFATQITPRSVIEKSVRQSVADPTIVDDAMVDRYWELLRFPGNREATSLRATLDRQMGMAERFGEIKASTLVLFGKKDHLILPSAAQSFQDRMPGAKVVLFDNIGHLPMEEAPEATAVAITDFLNSRDAVPEVRPETQ